MRKLLSALVLLAGLAVAPVAAHATPVTYDLTLTNVIGNVSGGTGSLTVDSAPGSGFQLFSQGGAAGSALTDMSFTIGGDTFTLADGTGAQAGFLNAGLLGILYSGNLSSGKVTIALASAGLAYAFYDQLTALYSTGYIEATPAVASAPEPGSLLLFGTGALGIAAFAARKFAV